jgi:hypothetical protein
MIEPTYVQNRRDVSAEVFDAEVVLVNFTTGRYFALRGAGARFWAHLAAPIGVQALGAAVAAEFGADAGLVQADAAALLDTLAAEALAVPAEAADAAAPVPVQTAAGTYAPPALDVFDELEELIALDPIHDADADAGWPVRPAAVE